MDQKDQQRTPQAESPPQLSRRGFLKGAGSVIALSSIATLTGCETAAPAQPLVPANPIPMELQYPQVPNAPATPPVPGVLRFFTPHEARTVEALTARLLPGTPEDPGAREAGVITYIDNLLAYQYGYNEAIYREPPYAQVYEGDTPPEDDAFDVIWVPASEIERYGYQSILTPREVYRMGLPAVDRYAREQFGGTFVELTEEQQDSIIQDMLDNRATGFDSFPSEAFFHVLRRHTSEGMFSDPAYGGNRNMAGWRLVGYPGAQRAYTSDNIRTEGYFREPQSLHDLAHFHPGHPAGPHVILPVSGSDLTSEDPAERTAGYP